MSRPRGTARAAVTAACAGLLVGVAVSGGGTTYAAWSDTQTLAVQAGAGVWAPDPPESCGPLSSFAGAVPGGLADNDALGSSNCVGGGGADNRLDDEDDTETPLSGPAEDVLDVGNAEQTMSAGESPVDTCDGGLEKSITNGCASTTPVAPLPDQGSASELLTATQPAPASRAGVAAAPTTASATEPAPTGQPAPSGTTPSPPASETTTSPSTAAPAAEPTAP